VIVTSDDYLLRIPSFLFEKREKATSDERRHGERNEDAVFTGP
jgi:hypothetical protein